MMPSYKGPIVIIVSRAIHFFCMCTRVSFWKMYVLLCHHGCGSESAFDHCSYFFSLFTTHLRGKVVNRLACEKALHLGGDARGHARAAHES